MSEKIFLKISLIETQGYPNTLLVKLEICMDISKDALVT